MELIKKSGITRNRRKPHGPAKNISSAIKKNLSPRMLKILRLCGALADQKGLKAYAVGGFARDILLNVSSFDVDIVLERECLVFAKALADKLGGSLVVYKRFGTATVVMDWCPKAKRGPVNRKERFKIDIATARVESYEHPAALPKVVFSSIKQDLHRRDFTINAMAVSLNKGSFGRLIDFFNGQRDLRQKKVRVLHDLSFIEDPTRIFRAVRFEQRYNFKIEPHTEELIKTAVRLDMFGRTQKQRLRNELILILSEPEPVKALTRMHELHELRFIHPRLRLTKGMLRLFGDIGECCRWYESSFLKKRPIDRWLIFFFAMVDGLDLAQVKALCEKFVFTKGDEKRIISCKGKADKVIRALKAKRELAPSRIYRHLEPLAYEVILFILAKAKSERVRMRVSLFLAKYNGVKPSISGKDLKGLGIAPGPRYGKILDRVLYEKLDGRLLNKQDEMRLARQLSGKA
ncbi:MAG: CCA tRNA nucleotidyltransferase [Candidatus Omnitrophica bacterium]|nr:CCA tRNA nucleotidyltransferase [Candidatus Omnitrophota bacterium]